MSAKATGIVWESNLPRPEKYVLLALADHAKEDGSDVYPSLGKVEWKTGYSETQVREIMRSLVKQKILVLVRKGGNGPTDTHKYRIDYKALTMLQEFREWSAGKKGAKSEPISNGAKGVESEPMKGAVSVKKGCGLGEKKGAETEPEPRTIRTKNNLEGNEAGSLPGIELNPAQEQKPQAKAQDPRFPEMCEAIRKCWPKGEGQKCDITAADAGAINRMLAKHHDWKAEELALCVVARFMSGSVNPTESVKAWIGAITDYQSGPQDKFGVPLHVDAALNRWRNQARTVLYGEQPEQLALSSAAKDRGEETARRHVEQMRREEAGVQSAIEALFTLPESEFAELQRTAEKDLGRYREKMNREAYDKIIWRAMAKLRLSEQVSA